MAKMETRLKQLSQLNSYIRDVDKDVTMILQNLQWDRNSILKGLSMAKCSYNTNHNLPLSKKETHEMVCFLKSQGYSDDDQLLPDPLDVNSNTLVKLNTQDIVTILNNTSSWDPLFKKGNKQPRFSEPWTLERLQSTYTADERRAIHDAVVQAVPSCHDLADLALPSHHDADESNKVKSRVEILAELRDMKRRRPKYRIAAKTRNYSDVLRDVIKTQMEYYSEMPHQKKTLSIPALSHSNNGERDNTSCSTGEGSIQNEPDTYISTKDVRYKHPKEMNVDSQILSKNYISFNRTDRETCLSNFPSKSKRTEVRRGRERENQIRHDDYSSSAFTNHHYIYNKSDRRTHPTLENDFRESQTQNESRRGTRDQNIPVSIKMEGSKTSDVEFRHRQTLISHRSQLPYSTDKYKRSDASNRRSSDRRTRRNRKSKGDKDSYSPINSERSDTPEIEYREKRVDCDKRNKHSKACKTGNSKIEKKKQDTATDIDIRGETFETSEKEQRPRTCARYTGTQVNINPCNFIKKEKIELPEFEERGNLYSTGSQRTIVTESGCMVPIKMEKTDIPGTPFSYSRTKSGYSSSSYTEDDNSENDIKREIYDTPDRSARDRQSRYYNTSVNTKNHERHRDKRAIQMKTTPERQPRHIETERIYYTTSTYAGNSKTPSKIAINHTEVPDDEITDRWTRTGNKDSTGNAKETNRYYYKNKNVRRYSASSCSSSSETETKCDDSRRHKKYRTGPREEKRDYGERDDYSRKKYNEKSNSYRDNKDARHYVKHTSESYHEETRKRKTHS